VSEKYVVIEAHLATFDVTMMCRVLDVSRAGFYAAQRRAPSRHAVVDAQLLGLVRGAFATAKARYGSAATRSARSASRVSCAKRNSSRVPVGGSSSRRTADTMRPSH
jgi:hypothetical protein